LNAIFADPTFYTREDSTTDVISEHVEVKKRLARYEEQWFLLNEELEEELARQKGGM
jgi:ATP-binding cassette subfamily F protein 3